MCGRRDGKGWKGNLADERYARLEFTCCVCVDKAAMKKGGVEFLEIVVYGETFFLGGFHSLNTKNIFVGRYLLKVG